MATYDENGRLIPEKRGLRPLGTVQTSGPVYGQGETTRVGPRPVAPTLGLPAPGTGFAGAQQAFSGAPGGTLPFTVHDTIRNVPQPTGFADRLRTAGGAFNENLRQSGAAINRVGSAIGGYVSDSPFGKVLKPLAPAVRPALRGLGSLAGIAAPAAGLYDMTQRGINFNNATDVLGGFLGKKGQVALQLGKYGLAQAGVAGDPNETLVGQGIEGVRNLYNRFGPQAAPVRGAETAPPLVTTPIASGAPFPANAGPQPQATSAPTTAPTRQLGIQPLPPAAAQASLNPDGSIQAGIPLAPGQGRVVNTGQAGGFNIDTGTPQATGAPVDARTYDALRGFAPTSGSSSSDRIARNNRPAGVGGVAEGIGALAGVRAGVQMRNIAQQQDRQRGLLGIRQGELEVHQANAVNTAENNRLQRGLQALQLEDQSAARAATAENQRATREQATRTQGNTEYQQRLTQLSKALDIQATDETGKVNGPRRALLERAVTHTATQSGVTPGNLNPAQLDEIQTLDRVNQRLQANEGAIASIFSKRPQTSNLTDLLPKYDEKKPESIAGAFERGPLGGLKLITRGGEKVDVGSLVNAETGLISDRVDADVAKLYGPYIQQYKQYEAQKRGIR